MYAISSYRGNRPTNTQRPPVAHRQDRLQYAAPQLARSVKMTLHNYKFTERIGITDDISHQSFDYVKPTRLLVYDSSQK